jgi:hypothetical protein
LRSIVTVVGRILELQTRVDAIDVAFKNWGGSNITPVKNAHDDNPVTTWYSSLPHLTFAFSVMAPLKSNCDDYKFIKYSYVYIDQPIHMFRSLLRYIEHTLGGGCLSRNTTMAIRKIGALYDIIALLGVGIRLTEEKSNQPLANNTSCMWQE